MDEKKKKLSELHAEHREQNWPVQHWRSWGSWFSWGSPVGLGLFAVLLAIAFAILKFAFTL
jgi:hypothetical protein